MPGARRRLIPGSVARASLLLALGLAACVPPESALPPPPRLQLRPPPLVARPRFEHAPWIDGEVLPSGLLLLVESDMNATSAGVVAVVQGGSSEDPPGAEGLAHLVEHLTFRATDPPSAMPLPLADDPPVGVQKRASRAEQLIVP